MLDYSPAGLEYYSNHSGGDKAVAEHSKQHSIPILRDVLRFEKFRDILKVANLLEFIAFEKLLGICNYSDNTNFFWSSKDSIQSINQEPYICAIHDY